MSNRMNDFAKIGIFIAVGLILNQMVFWIFRLISKKAHAIHLHFARSVITVLINVIMIYSLAQQFEITKDISKTLLQSGSLLVAIATFAAQQALANLISGVSISFSKPYNVDEKIRVVQNGNIIAEGMVKDVTMRHTVISQFNGESCIVPNSVMDSAVIINTNFTENVGNFLEIEVAYDTDIEEAIRIMCRVCAEHELTLNTETDVVTVRGYTQNGVILKTTIWAKDLNDSFRACSDIRVALVKEFRNHNITIPYQRVTICNEEA